MDGVAGWKWRARVEQETRSQPTWMPDGTPACALDECGRYDGKRCRLMGFRPGTECAPAVAEMAAMLNAQELGERP